MYSNSDLEDAVAAGILSRDQLDALNAHIEAVRGGPAVDEENVRLITSFNDIFVTIAIMIVMAGLLWATGFDTVSSVAIIAVASWGLAEFFTRVRRMALPSIILLLTFVWSVVGTAAILLFGSLDHVAMDPVAGAPEAEMAMRRMIALRTLAMGAIGVGAAWLHWRRFQVPITVAAGVVCLVAAIMGLVTAAVPAVEDHYLMVLFVLGLGVFALAMRWDMSDRHRQTRRSDVAFWLHLAAAPMIVHPLFMGLGLLGDDGTLAAATGALGIYVVLAIVALLIDRRALLVSALVYVLGAMSFLLRNFGAIGDKFALTAVVIGSALLMLSAFWHRLRAWLLDVAPPSLRDRLPAER